LEARSILGVSNAASLQEARKMYKSLLKVLHPDVNSATPEQAPQATQATAHINEAWDTPEDLVNRGLLGKVVDDHVWKQQLQVHFACDPATKLERVHHLWLHATYQRGLPLRRNLPGLAANQLALGGILSGVWLRGVPRCPIAPTGTRAVDPAQDPCTPGGECSE
jgi:hypothetical protein